MRVLTHSTILGTALVALAILNFSVLDQIGVGLVDSVHAKFEDLGAEWIGLQVSSPRVDPDALAAAVAAVPGVRASVAYWSTNVPDFGTAAVTSPRPGGVLFGQVATTEYVMTSEAYDLQAHPYLFVFHEDTETRATFYRDAIAWVEGGPPGPGEVALGTDTAAQAGVGVGDVFAQAFGATPFNHAGTYAAEFTVSGVYQRAFADPGGNPPDIVVVGPNPDLRGAPVASTQMVIVQATLSDVLHVVEDIVERVQALGHTVSTERFQVRPGRGGAMGGGFGPGGGGGMGGPGGGFQAGGQGPADVLLFSNGDVLASALDAADRAGAWFRMLTTGAVVLAVLGIAFVTAATERKVRRDVGIRQAVGYPVRRIYLHWATVSTVMGLAGAAGGIGLVWAMSGLGLGPTLLGLDLAFRPSTGALVAPLASILVYALATLPTYAKVIRANPAQNLRVLRE